MARTDTLTNFLTDVAAAIKAKKGDETAIPAADFDTEIANLPSGDDTMLISLIDRTATSIEIPEGATSIGNCAFYNYSSLTSITIPNSVTSIGGSTFYGCKGLTSVIIPNNVTTIGSSAFRDCQSLTSIIIPNSVRGFSSSTFYGCKGLTSATIGNGVEIIGSFVFRNCTSLTSVTIGNKVRSIFAGAFYGCTSLTEIDFSTHTAIPTLKSTDAFSGTPESLVIKVPSALVDEWKAATNWVAYADKIMGV